MAQQHGIIVLFDVENALRTRSLDGNTYWFDNMKLLGSVGVGTEQLVTIVPGTHFLDGSQATEQVLNWLPAALGSIPRRCRATTWPSRNAPTTGARWRNWPRSAVRAA